MSKGDVKTLRFNSMMHEWIYENSLIVIERVEIGNIRVG